MLANLVALPLCDLSVMPLALAVLIALPFGLEYWPLVAMGWGINGMTYVAQAVAALPGSVVRIPAIPTLSFALLVSGGLWLLLWSRTWRLLGLIPIAAGILWSPVLSRPDVLVSRDGATVAVRAADGRLSAVAVRGGMFELSRWLEYDGDNRAAKDVAAAQGFSCDAIGCISPGGDRAVAVLAGAVALRDACGRASVIVMRFLAPNGCPGASARSGAFPVVIDQAASRAGGAHMLFFRSTGIYVQTVEAARGVRPWSQLGRLAEAATGRRDSTPGSVGAARAVEVPFATPQLGGTTDDDDSDQVTRPGLW